MALAVFQQCPLHLGSHHHQFLLLCFDDHFLSCFIFALILFLKHMLSSFINLKVAVHKQAKKGTAQLSVLFSLVFIYFLILDQGLK